MSRSQVTTISLRPIVTTIFLASFWYGVLACVTLVMFSSSGIRVFGLALRQGPLEMLLASIAVAFSIGMITGIILLWQILGKTHVLVKFLVTAVVIVVMRFVVGVGLFGGSFVVSGAGDDGDVYRLPDGRRVVHVTTNIWLDHEYGYHQVVTPLFRTAEPISDESSCDWIDESTGEPRC